MMEMNRETATAADPLLEHRAFVTGLTRALLGRDSRVEDVVQDTFAIAVERCETRRGPMRAWLSGIVQNLVGTIRRRDPARRRRETRAARNIRLPSTEEVVSREQTRRVVLRAVLSLDEPYREAILYRYYEELRPREIAAAIGAPVETVRTRLKRGLALLRSRLDSVHGGDRKAWTLALLPLAGLGALPASAAAGGATAATSLGVLAMTTKAKIVLGTLLVLLLLVGIVIGPGGGREAGPPDSAPPLPEITPDAAPFAEPEAGIPMAPTGEPDEALLTAHRAAVKAALSGKRPPAGRRPLPVRVTSEESDEPVAGAKITLKWDFARSGGRWPQGGVYEWTAVTEHGGEFRFESLPPGCYKLAASHSDFASRGLSGIEVKASGEVVPFPVHLVRDPSKLGVVEGVVLDPFGNAVEGAEVVVHAFEGMIRQRDVTGADGSYRVERLLPGHYRVSVVRRPGEGKAEKLWERIQSAAVRPGEVARVDFRGSGTLSGILLDSEGTPIAGARILVSRVRGEEKAADRRGTTGKDGRFSITDAGVGRRRIIVGWGMGSVYGREIDLSGSDRETEIRLEPGEITGKVLLPGGRVPALTGLFPGIAAYRLDGETIGPIAASGGLDVAGAYRMRGLPPGRYRMRLYAKGYRTLTADVEITRSEQKVTKDFTLEPLVLGTVRVTVTDAEGSPVEGIRMSYGEQNIVGRTVDRDMPSPGIYVSRMEVGKWVLVLYGDRLVTKILEIEVKKDVETKLEVEMEWKD